MDALTFQLKIPDRWMLWRIYHAKGDEQDGETPKVKDNGWDLYVQWDWTCRGPGYCRQPDPIDEDSFNEAVSFPSVKPDRDLFGPPLRCSRKQRGWYHVNCWPPADLVPSPQHYSTGTDIPQELFDNILEHFDNGGYSRDDVKPLRLVCRRWERLCLHKMFDVVTLRNHRDVSTLSTLLNTRMALSRTLETYPVDCTEVRVDLEHAEGWRPWVDLPRLLSKLEAIPCYERTEWFISGPLPIGRRLTSVYLSLPCRPHWRPPNIHILFLDNIHFTKLGDLIRLLRELPSLRLVSGSDLTWDESLRYPRLTSFIPYNRPHSSVEYCLNKNQPELGRILVCALALSGSRLVAQSDADILYGLVSALKPAPQQDDDHPQRFQSGLYIGCDCPWPDVHVGFRTTQGKTQLVQSIAFDFCETLHRAGDLLVRMDKHVLDSIFDFIEKLVQVTRSAIMFLFPSAEAAASFLETFSAKNIAVLVTSGTVKCVLEFEEEKTLRLVESDHNGGWRALATRKYQYYGTHCDKADSRAQALHELGAWSAVNRRY